MATVDLSDVPALRRHSLADLEALAAVADAQEFAKGAVLCKEGQPGDCCYLILSGDVEVSKTMDAQRKRVAILGPGDFVGQLALVDGAPRSASVVVRYPVKALVLTCESFIALLAARTSVALRLQKQVAIAIVRQLRDATRQFVALKRDYERARDDLTRSRSWQKQRDGAMQVAAAMSELSIPLDSVGKADGGAPQ